MTKKEKKKVSKLEKQIATLELNLYNSLKNKKSSTVEINIAKEQAKIKLLKESLERFLKH